MLYNTRYNILHDTKPEETTMQAPLSNERIHEVADQLAAAGQRPTLAAVREALGGGSFTTISEAMKLWRKQASEQEQLQPLVEALPDVLQQAALTTAAAVWREAQALAASRLEAERQALAQAQETLEAEQAETVELVALLERDLELSRTELADVVAKAADAEVVSNARITKNANELDSLRAELTQAVLRAERAEAKAVEIERRAVDLRAELDRAHQDADKTAAALAEQKTVADKYRAAVEHEKAKNVELDSASKRLLEQYQQAAADLVKATEKADQAAAEIAELKAVQQAAQEASIQAAAANARLETVEKQAADLLDRLTRANTVDKKKGSKE